MFMSSQDSYFVTIAETRNLTTAANLLHVSQPSLSQYITRLEKKLGVKLLERNTTPLKFTPAGLVYLDYVKARHELEEDLYKKLQKITTNEANVLNIGIPSQLSTDLYNTLLLDFITLHPELAVNVKDGNSPFLAQELADHTLTLSFLFSVKPSDSQFESQIIDHACFYLICNAGCSFLNGRKSSLDCPAELTSSDKKALQNYCFVSAPRDFYLQRTMTNHLQRYNIHTKGQLELPNLDTILSYIRRNKNSITFMPDYVLSKLENAEDFAVLHLDSPSFEWYLTINRPKDIPVSDNVELLWSYVINKNWRF